MNTNMIHNILNALMAVLGIATSILVSMGCTQLADGKLDCSASTAPEWLLPWVVGAAGIIGTIKVIMNLVRDGFGGLFKQQPPVATDVKTVVVTGDANSVTKVETVAPSGQVVIK